jgi:hypothetical protein
VSASIYACRPADLHFTHANACTAHWQHFSMPGAFSGKVDTTFPVRKRDETKT